MQIAFVVHSIGEYTGVKVHACVGGTIIKEDIKKLKDGGTHVVVGTPGRIHDMMKRGFLKTDYLKLFVMDEADEMLSRGFKTQIQDIFKYLPGDVQIALYSATLPKEILQMTTNFMRDPAKILVKSQQLTLEGIKQYYLSCSTDQNKYENLFEIFGNIDVNHCIIYSNTKDKAEVPPRR